MVRGFCTAPNLHTDFMDVLNNNALTQLVKEPTRQQNTLDLILTNHPGKVIRTDTISGISDHDIVYTEFDLRPVKLQQKPRIIPLYNKANWLWNVFYCRFCYCFFEDIPHIGYLAVIVLEHI
jgi:hypothetical protein